MQMSSEINYKCAKRTLFDLRLFLKKSASFIRNVSRTFPENELDIIDISIQNKHRIISNIRRSMQASQNEGFVTTR